MDEQEERWKKWESLFLECIKDDKMDLEAFRKLLGDREIEETYSFTWPGKERAYLLSKEPPKACLVSKKEESRDWETTKNLFIEGENLEALKVLQEDYCKKIGMIYIDPPYNTNRDFVYQDSYADKERKKMGTKKKSGGSYHRKWLSMMYPRLLISRNLLKEDGIILINIDEHEYVNLQKLMEEIYGEDNHLGTIIWDKRNPKGDVKGIATQHEYIVVYTKNKKEYLQSNPLKRKKKNAEKILRMAEDIYNKYKDGNKIEEGRKEFARWMAKQKSFSGGEKAYNKIDENGQVYRLVSMAWPNKKKPSHDYFTPLIHPVTGKECPVPHRGWRNSPAKMRELLEKGEIIFGKDETTQPARKYLLKDNQYENIPSVMYYGGSDDLLLKDMGIPFDTPKVLSIVTEHILNFSKKGDKVLDFFAGSATTAHGVMKANAMDGGERSFLIVQMPEQIEKKHEAYKKGFRKVSELTKRRIEIAGDHIIKEKKGVDTGFRKYVLTPFPNQDKMEE